MYRLDTKLAKIRAGKYAKGDFIIADAKDGDMSNPIPGTGPVRDATGQLRCGIRTRAEFLEIITEIIRQDVLDIMLVSASNLELLTEAGAFKGSAVKPAFRANDTTDIWGARPNGYGKLGPSRPFRTPVLKDVAKAGLSDLGLYSVTFVNDIEADLRSLEAFAAFREDAAANGIKYFLEVFNPNVDSGIPPEADRQLRERQPGALPVRRSEGQAPAIPQIPVQRAEGAGGTRHLRSAARRRRPRRRRRHQPRHLRAHSIRRRNTARGSRCSAARSTSPRASSISSASCAWLPMAR